MALKELGRIIGETTHSKIIFTANRPPRVGEYVIVEYPELEIDGVKVKHVLAMVESSTIGNPALLVRGIKPEYVEKASQLRLERSEYMIGSARLIGWVELLERGRLYTPKHPPKPGARVYEASSDVLKKIFEKEESFIIRGRVFSGLGEGRYYVSLEGYRKQFIEKLGFDPYPGTLNIKIQKEELYFRRRLDGEEGILIKGFTTKDRTFGDVKAFKCRVGEIKGAVVIPQRTHYPIDVLEIIAPVRLRDVLNLKDGDFVEVEVYL